MGDAKGRAKLASAMAEVHRLSREGGCGPTGGVMMVEIARGPALLTSCLHLLLQFGRLIWDDGRPLCLACDHEFRRTTSTPVALSIATPISRSEDPPVIVSGICERCAELSDEELTEHVYQHLKRMGMADRKLGTAQVSSVLQ